MRGSIMLLQRLCVCKHLLADTTDDAMDAHKVMLQRKIRIEDSGAIVAGKQLVLVDDMRAELPLETAAVEAVEMKVRTQRTAWIVLVVGVNPHIGIAHEM